MKIVNNLFSNLLSQIVNNLLTNLRMCQMKPSSASLGAISNYRANRSRRNNKSRDISSLIIFAES